MAAQTEITWCDSTFNPWIGCTKVGPGCDHCYAERDMDQRRHRVKWGAGQERSRTSADYWKQPLRWNRARFGECRFCGWRGECREANVTEVAFPCPSCRHAIGWAVPARRRVFCASLADVFDNEVDPQWRIDLLHLIAATPNLDWLLLTKRIGNAERMIGESGGWPDPLPNVWLGATVVNQAEAERDVPKLLATPAAVRFLSIEPMLGAVDIRAHLEPDWTGDMIYGPCDKHPGLDWIVVGGESGPAARPMHPDWALSLRDQCAAADVPFLFKQWGEWAPVYYRDQRDGRLVNFSSTKDETVLGEPTKESTWVNMRRMGKKAAGRLLDGTLHTGFPRSV